MVNVLLLTKSIGGLNVFVQQELVEQRQSLKSRDPLRGHVSSMFTDGGGRGVVIGPRCIGLGLFVDVLCYFTRINIEVLKREPGRQIRERGNEKLEK